MPVRDTSPSARRGSRQSPPFYTRDPTWQFGSRGPRGLGSFLLACPGRELPVLRCRSSGLLPGLAALLTRFEPWSPCVCGSRRSTAGEDALPSLRYHGNGGVSAQTDELGSALMGEALDLLCGSEKECGDVAQLGERGLCKPEVVGSIPIVSTRTIAGHELHVLVACFCFKGRGICWGYLAI